MRKKLTEMKQAHGKQEKFVPTTLDQVWGDTGISKYKTLDEAAYAAELAEMNKSDLISHACKVGVVPADDRERLIKKLLTQFKQHVSQYRVASLKPEAPKEVSKEVLKILAEGR